MTKAENRMKNKKKKIIEIQTQIKKGKIICDSCNNYEVSAGGCMTKCHAVKVEPFSTMTLPYFSERESGEKKTCKSFNRLPKRPRMQ